MPDCEVYDLGKLRKEKEKESRKEEKSTRGGRKTSR